MAVQVNLVEEDITILTNKDNIVIIDNQFSIPGGKSLDVTRYPEDVLNAGHVIIKETATGNYKPMPIVEASAAGVATVGAVTAGTGYTNGTYTNVPLAGGTGTGVLATVTVAGTVVTVVTITQAGKNYTVADVLTVPAAYAGGTSTTSASVPVATLSSVTGSYSALPSGHTYEGILVATILTKRPFAGVMLEGWVNENAAPFSMTSIKSAFLTAVGNKIKFRGDLS